MVRDGVTWFGDTLSKTVTVIAPGQPPTCSITFSPSSPLVGGTVSFDSHAADPDLERRELARR